MRPFLSQVEKKLQSQMMKLPSLNGLHGMNENPTKMKKGQGAGKVRDVEDQELRQIKRNIAKIKKKQSQPKPTLT